jgi:hypothetical protein
MIVTVLVPSEEYKDQAGSRIRYRRLAPYLGQRGVELRLLDIGKLDFSTTRGDVYIFSKCHDARALIAAATLSQQGRFVGVDLFDDYFSEACNSRLSRFRDWLSQLLGFCDFGLCSTGAMAEVLRQYRSDLPVHVLNDPAPDQDLEALPDLLLAKLAEARHSGQIRAVWFGQGDNPYFDVGLSDLNRHAADLRKFRGRVGSAKLTILTNARALTADGLSLVRDLPIQVEIKEWSETAECDALGTALLAFLPVGAGAFSAAKSLNRAVTALSEGCQILSTGYPLYAGLDPLIYRDASEFMADLDRGTLRFSPGTMDIYRDRIRAAADAGREAAKLADFLSVLIPKNREVTLPLSVVHGFGTRNDTHDLVKTLGGLSVASPSCTAPLDFDVLFQGDGASIDMMVSGEASRRLRPGFRGKLKRGPRIRGRKYEIVVSDAFAPPIRLRADGQQGPSAAYELAGYPAVLGAIEQRMKDAFGRCEIIVSDSSNLPFSIVGSGT